jgi:hypothetical protein
VCPRKGSVRRTQPGGLYAGIATTSGVFGARSCAGRALSESPRGSRNDQRHSAWWCITGESISGAVWIAPGGEGERAGQSIFSKAQKGPQKTGRFSGDRIALGDRNTTPLHRPPLRLAIFPLSRVVRCLHRRALARPGVPAKIGSAFHPQADRPSKSYPPPPADTDLGILGLGGTGSVPPS